MRNISGLFFLIMEYTLSNNKTDVETSNMIVIGSINFFVYSIYRMLIYCVHRECRKQTETKDLKEFVNKKGLPAYRGRCVKCGGVKCSFPKREKK
jgi:hypothetical protein